jgi:formate dehydrogenase iron-sulfur subunit
MTQSTSATAIKTTLIDITKCIGCRACQVACKQWNDREGEATTLQDYMGFQNPATLSAKTYTLITFHELPNEKAPGGLQYLFTMRRCLHCLEPACASACPTTALASQPDGPVTYDANKCIGCRYCIWACPWGVPTAEWDSLAPKIQKCTHCADRSNQPVPLARNGKALSEEERNEYERAVVTPACVKACPADCLRFGTRDEMLQDARSRISGHPDKYVDHIYGENEAGGTSVLYLSSVPFEKLGFPSVEAKSYPSLSRLALHAVPPAVLALGALLGGVYSLLKRRKSALVNNNEGTRLADGQEHHEEHQIEFESLHYPLLTSFNWVLLVLMTFGVISLIARFAMGLGGSTHLSDTYAWGLWIVFDLVWIAVAAGAFATVGLIYVFQRKELYSIGRSAVLMGLLSYSFVTVTLIADLGLPWHFYQLGLQAPEQSAMFEVSWCVGLYVTVLLIEFLPVPFERWGFQRAMEIWRRWSGVYVAFALSLFVYLLSRRLAYAALAAILFSAIAWFFRAGNRRGEPIMLAIAAVTLSTMHQSSLGSLFLLMPDEVAAQWWSPLMPISFFLSSIAAGTSLVILIEMWIAKGWRRQLQLPQLAEIGRISFWSLLIYLTFRIGDMVVRGQIRQAFSGRLGILFAVEIALGGILPLLLLPRSSQRARPLPLFLGAFLATAGVVFNRVNVVLLAMDLKGPMPQTSPASYFPSIFEWGISLGLIAATVFLFGLAARHLPVLPKRVQVRGAWVS